MDDFQNITDQDLERYFKSLETNKLKELSQEIKKSSNDDPHLIILLSDILRELSRRKKEE